MPRLRVAVLGMGHLPRSLPPTVERLAVVGDPAAAGGAAALEQAFAGLAQLLPQLPHLRELRGTTGEPALPGSLSSLLPPGCVLCTAGVPREGPAVDAWGRSLHQTMPLHMGWCDSLLTTAGINMAALELAPGELGECLLSRQPSGVQASG